MYLWKDMRAILFPAYFLLKKKIQKYGTKAENSTFKPNENGILCVDSSPTATQYLTQNIQFSYKQRNNTSSN